MKERSTIFFVLLTTTWLFFFFNMSGYGLYEDDYNVVGGFVDKSYGEVFSYIRSAFAEMIQGRPFAYAFPAFITLLGVHLTDNLIMIYSTGLLFVFINSFLVYLLLRKWLSLPASLMGAFIFLLTPADSAKILLTHNLILQPSVTCALLGIYFYCKQNKAYLILSYLLGIISLLFYESGLLIFLFAPFFFRKPGYVLMKSIIIHVVVLAIVVFLVSFLRATGGESRVAELVAGNKLTLLLKIVSAPFIGVAGSGAAMLYGTWMGIKNSIGIQLIPVMFFGGLVIYWLKKWISKNAPAGNYVHPKLKIKLARWSFNFDHATYISITGFLMILASYLLSFTHYPPIAISSRATSVHLAATIAWGVFLAGILELILLLKGRYQLKQLSIAFCGLIIMFWSSYALYLQRGYIMVWNGQKDFWNQLRQVAPDINNRSILIFDNNVVEYSTTPLFGKRILIKGADWALPYASNIYFTGREQQRPLTYKSLDKPFEFKKENSKVLFYNDGFPDWGKWVEVEPANTILISMNQAGDLIRPEFIDLNIKKPPLIDSSKAFIPTGPLFTFITTGKFGIHTPTKNTP